MLDVLQDRCQLVRWHKVHQGSRVICTVRKVLFLYQDYQALSGCRHFLLSQNLQYVLYRMRADSSVVTSVQQLQYSRLNIPGQLCTFAMQIFIQEQVEIAICPLPYLWTF